MKKYFILIILLFFIPILGYSKTTQHYTWNSNNDVLKNYVLNHRKQMINHIVNSYRKGIPYRKKIEKILTKNHVPKELYALASVESNFYVNSISQQGAVGMWQLMPNTARKMGLIVNKRIDERKNWIKSTKAAAKYLHFLATQYFNGNYELAILAYNSGPGTVLKAIKKNHTTNPWILIKDHHIFQKETTDYLIKIVSSIRIFHYIDIKYQEKELAKNH